MKSGKLEIKLINYFLLIAFAAMLIGAEFLFEINQTTQQAGEYVASHLLNIRNKIVIMFAVLTVVVAIVLTMFVKHITIPLCNIADVAKRINAGDLSQTVQVDSQDEIGQVGEAINELTSNFQEIATFTRSTVKHTIEKIEDAIVDIESSQMPDAESLKDVKSSILALDNLLGTLKLLQPDNSFTR